MRTIVLFLLVSCSGKSGNDTQIDAGSTGDTSSSQYDTDTTQDSTLPDDTALTDSGTDSDIGVPDTGEYHTGDTALIEDTASTGDTSTSADTGEDHDAGNVGTEEYTAIAVGWGHTIAITPEGELVCWGGEACEPTNAPEGPLEEVCADAGYSCAIDTVGELTCWTHPKYAGAAIIAEQPSEVTTSAVGCGSFHACILDDTGSPHCWGGDYGYSDDYGQVSDTPTDLTGLSDLRVGDYHNCATSSEGEQVCWGSNEFGETGNVESGYVDYELGWYVTAALNEDGEATFWGNNISAMNADVNGRYFQQLSASQISNPYCGIQLSGEIYCWNGIGTDARLAPEGGNYTTVSVGLYHACALDPDGYAHCWGNDSYGEASPP